MTENFNKYIGHIDADFWRDLCLSKGELRCYDRGEEFVSIGKRADYIGYVKTGTLKYVVYSEDSTEHVIGLEFAGEFVADFPFSLFGKKARSAIVAVSECEIYCVPVPLVVEMMEADGHVRDVVLQSTEALFSTVYDRYSSLYTRTARERYDDLINYHPDLFQLFSLKDIASYLNITPTHLGAPAQEYSLRVSLFNIC